MSQHSFDEPWQAELFALTTHLNERGVFGWPEWSAQFGAKLAQAGKHRPIEGGDDYYHLWLECLLEFLSELGHADHDDVDLMGQRLKYAYQNTPHGQPVRL